MVGKSSSRNYVMMSREKQYKGCNLYIHFFSVITRVKCLGSHSVMEIPFTVKFAVQHPLR